MPLIQEAQTFFTQSGGTPNLIAVPAGASVTVRSTGATLYYKTTSDVTSASSDGTIATGADATFTGSKYVITATGASTEVFAKTNETLVASDVTVTDDLTVTDAATFSGAATITGTSTPTAIPNWQPVAATSGTDTAFANGTLFLTSIFVPSNKTLTGVGVLLGSVGGTDRVVVNLISTAGVYLAQSTVASAGTVAGTTATYQSIAFASTYAATGPNRYFVGVAANGNTAKLRTVPAETGVGIHCGSVSQTHAATTAVTVPTAFAADKAPVCFLY